MNCHGCIDPVNHPHTFDCGDAPTTTTTTATTTTTTGARQ